MRKVATRTRRLDRLPTIPGLRGWPMMIVPATFGNELRKSLRAPAEVFAIAVWWTQSEGGPRRTTVTALCVGGHVADYAVQDDFGAFLATLVSAKAGDVVVDAAEVVAAWRDEERRTWQALVKAAEDREKAALSRLAEAEAKLKRMLDGKVGEVKPKDSRMANLEIT